MNKNHHISVNIDDEHKQKLNSWKEQGYSISQIIRDLIEKAPLYFNNQNEHNNQKEQNTMKNNQSNDNNNEIIKILQEINIMFQEQLLTTRNNIKSYNSQYIQNIEELIFDFKNVLNDLEKLKDEIEENDENETNYIDETLDEINNLNNQIEDLKTKEQTNE